MPPTRTAQRGAGRTLILFDDAERDWSGELATRQAAVRRLRVADPGAAEVLAQGQRPDGGVFPLLVGASDLRYVAESPLDYTTATDRHLAFGDVLFDVLAPGTPERHRALVRSEDVSPDSAPGQPTFGLEDRPKVVEALHYLTSHGGLVPGHSRARTLQRLDRGWAATAAILLVTLTLPLLILLTTFSVVAFCTTAFSAVQNDGSAKVLSFGVAPVCAYVYMRADPRTGLRQLSRRRTWAKSRRLPEHPS
ncbi:hypothetical protein [Streptomyces sp. NPDC050759]|uniref:hypothetical protein n=1 Tax=Streptomyces sp. NPDC050759 TaxID=3365635 RepID=UPI0037A75005